MRAIREFFLKLKRTFVSKKFLEFCVFGLVNTITHGLFSKLFSHFMQANAAYVVGFFFSNFIAFFLNSYFIFKKSPTLKRYTKFIVSYIPCLIIGFLVTFITINTLKLPQFWGTILAAMVGGPLTYIIMKVYTFGRK
ncbi:MAG: GtrA family protein [Clostridia bacterium]|nr:GtrA family protein [Clostridia bacterium]